VTTSSSGDLQNWLAALETELRLVEQEGFFTPDEELETLYVGGGTPSLLGPDAMAGLLRLFGRDRLSRSDLEWTSEANPESLSVSVARGWAASGVNRISMGVQSFQATVLRFLNRLHGPEQAGLAVGNARAAGIQNLNLDLMFGLPGEVERNWDQDLDSILRLGVPHISLYGLSLEMGTPLAAAIERGRISEPSEDAYGAEFLRASDRLTSEGYRHYEVSNFALPGFESRHNQTYWELDPYLGLGTGAHSYRAGRRRWNLRDWGEYRRACRGGVAPWQEEEELTPADSQLEAIWLGLRTDRGLGMETLNAGARALVDDWVSNGRATVGEEGVRLTAHGWLLLDQLVVELDLALSRRVPLS
jgi:oxygen-independent coproporphyrinogen-3 oxidase